MEGLSVRHRGALAFARAAAWTSRRVLGRGGNVVGGAVLMRLAGDLASTKAPRHRITLVTGTNGKSTTTAMVTAALRTRGEVATNADGANTPHGLVWCVANARAREIVLEVDESWVPWAVEVLHPAAVVLLNLTRDQLHRKPEIRPVADKWRQALVSVPHAVAVADDPAVTWAAASAHDVDYISSDAPATKDSVLCPECGEVLLHEQGSWSCSACGLSAPPADVRVVERHILVDGVDVGVYDRLPGEVNAINAAAAVAVTRGLVAPTVALEAVNDKVGEVEDRYRDLTVEGRNTRLLLAKNPAGWDATLGMLRPGASILMVFSAEGVDGRDTSWLYDVDFDELRGRQVAVAGPRGTDLVVRLHLDGIESGAAHASVLDALRALPPGDVDVVATYASFQTARRELRVA